MKRTYQVVYDAKESDGTMKYRNITITGDYNTMLKFVLTIKAPDGYEYLGTKTGGEWCHLAQSGSGVQ